MPTSGENILPIAALFRVVFDQKVGYTIAWARSRTQDGADKSEDETKQLLEGVEFKSLPSGLHEVEEDVVYFIHEVKNEQRTFAGVSCFTRKDADAAHRHAAFTSIGALARLWDGSGRLGRAWELVDALKTLAARINEQEDENDGRVLEEWWQALPKTMHNDNAVNETDDADQEPRTDDLEANLVHTSHPSLAIPSMLDMFGPLIFPLYRAALLRKRILIVNAPPVLEECNFCFGLSVLSVLPPEVRDMVAGYETLQFTTLPTFFSIGIHDLAWLQEAQQIRNAKNQGWVATTTDSIIATKTDLFDVLIEMPAYRANAASRVSGGWPSLKTAHGKSIKASRRDLKHYLLLQRRRSEMGDRFASTGTDRVEATESEANAPLIGTHPQHVPGAFLEDLDGSGVDQHQYADIVEAPSWSQSVYHSLGWFTSAGDMSAFEQQYSDLEDDRTALRSVPSLMPSELANNDALREAWTKQKDAAQITSYFYARTSRTFEILDELVHEVDEGSHDEYDSACDVHLEGESVIRLGLDGDSSQAQEWVVEMFSKWTGRVAEFRKAVWEVCGMRIC